VICGFAAYTRVAYNRVGVKDGGIRGKWEREMAWDLDGVWVSRVSVSGVSAGQYRAGQGVAAGEADAWAADVRLLAG
jgi:hypothetical protein